MYYKKESHFKQKVDSIKYQINDLYLQPKGGKELTIITQLRDNLRENFILIQNIHRDQRKFVFWLKQKWMGNKTMINKEKISDTKSGIRKFLSFTTKGEKR